MRILAHRGWWIDPSDKNSRSAFKNALDKGLGIETDVRDFGGELVVSHDMPLRGIDSDRQMSLPAFLDLYVSYKTRPTLALNIKSDGLVAPLHDALDTRSISNYFVFDMSVPDTLGYLRKGMPVFTRRSEFEEGSILDERAQGFWLDKFEAPCVTNLEVAEALKTGKAVAIVSPELHAKPHTEAWTAWRGIYQKLSVADKDRIYLCTDLPGDAVSFFG
jgi:hypothetical protein